MFTVKARDGVTDLHGLIFRPGNFDPDQKYPLVDRIYPGPQIGGVFQRGFVAASRGTAGSTQSLAELGFIVIQLDAMGTPFRSKAFHDEWYGNMADNGLIDHVRAIEQLAERYPEIDIDRVGIYGAVVWEAADIYATIQRVALAAALLRYDYQVGVDTAFV